MRIIYTTTVLALLATAFLQCSPRQEHSDSFTKADSVTDFYLRMQDTLHVQWNLMITGDNKKIQAMDNLLHELMVTSADSSRYRAFNDRLTQLSRMRYTPKSMFNPDVVREYDYATRSLIVELVAAAESRSEYTYNVTMQKLVDEILLSDQHVTQLRQQYDSVAKLFNRFLERNGKVLVEANLTTDKKPLFDEY